MGDVGLLASWFILKDGAVFGLPISKLSKSMLTLPELAQVDPKGWFLLADDDGVVSGTLFVLEVGCSGVIGDGVSRVPIKN